MNDSKHRKERLEVGEGMNIDGPPPPFLYAGFVRGRRWGPNGACHSSVRHLFSQ